MHPRSETNGSNRLGERLTAEYKIQAGANCWPTHHGAGDDDSTARLSRLQQELHAAIQEYRDQITAVEGVIKEHPADEEAQQVRECKHTRLTASAQPHCRWHASWSSEQLNTHPCFLLHNCPHSSHSRVHNSVITLLPVNMARLQLHAVFVQHQDRLPTQAVQQAYPQTPNARFVIAALQSVMLANILPLIAADPC